jgi:hypothetical protein
MPAIDFPNSPSVNDTFTSGNTTWQYDGVSWSLVQSAQSIGTGSVTEDKLATGSVTVNKLGTGAVTSGKLATGSVTLDKIDADVWASDQAIISKQLFS